jgi:hypothetical protein
MRALKVWSQNLAHESMLTTYLGYGTVGPFEHAEIMKNLQAGLRSSEPTVEQGELISLLRQNLEVYGHR